MTPFLTASTEEDIPQFPFLALLISGGHTLLLLATSNTEFKTLATTSDESIGRCIDKVSRMLKLDCSAVGPGAALEQFCASPEETPEITANVPLPSITPGELKFSYSGLHSIVQRYISRCGGIDSMNAPSRLALARAFQTAAFAQLEAKLTLGLEACARRGVCIRHVVVSGGVASNICLRSRSVASRETRRSCAYPPLDCNNAYIMQTRRNLSP